MSFKKVERWRRTFFRAVERHREVGQSYDEFPYQLHLAGVIAATYRYMNIYWPASDVGFGGISNDNRRDMLIIAACFHDLMEDGRWTWNDVVRECVALGYSEALGRNAANIVYDLTSELGKNRRERNERTYPKQRANQLARFIKLCDRLANMRFSLYVYEEKGMYDKYVAEYQEFRRQLRIGEEFPELWAELDALAAAWVKRA